jgi:hypothetical protein
MPTHQRPHLERAPVSLFQSSGLDFRSGITPIRCYSRAGFMYLAPACLSKELAHPPQAGYFWLTGQHHFHTQSVVQTVKLPHGVSSPKQPWPTLPPNNQIWLRSTVRLAIDIQPPTRQYSPKYHLGYALLVFIHFRRSGREVRPSKLIVAMVRWLCAP